MYLHISGASATWRLKYRLGGKDKTLSIGRYPQIALKDAREARDEAKRLIAKNLDPAALKKAPVRDPSAITFQMISKAWWEHIHCKEVSSLRDANRNRNRLIQYVYPYIGDTPVQEIDAPKFCQFYARLKPES